ncbi:ATP:cob(I)alamin adenosyltransferase [Verrucomicrobium sp. GAS474]|uniref:cob(I)yrinic acid a,c-diamide adenosyltransferase n=1 Tax=Verrucomicrobium sp. GAS474 TaxID=1882831 RepID=UPI0008792A8B|nr:cob(I)yrinic acid a,c-diamide adenosyltransferase [Verrucomicrobium sp. GAS474]SDU07449.1 ATP:cob(I)alamin adenosyltransferase [Verrucomicrobium sp. GAS474]
MSSIATRTGDGGSTGLLGGGRVPKIDPRIEALGEIDELSAVLACAIARSTDPILRSEAALIREDLVNLMADVAETREKIWLGPAALAYLDSRIVALEAEGILFRKWDVEGFSDGAATVELGRAVCRRAERRVWALGEVFAQARPIPVRYLNRLSDFLWLLARKDLP